MKADKDSSIKAFRESNCSTLYPGDIVSTGTPRGVGAMKPGDVVEIEIEGVGKLRNKIVPQDVS